jgi:hypothetical protein
MLLLVGAMLAAATAAASTPSQDQYTFNLPTPHGNKPTGGQQPTSKPDNLSPTQQAAASGPDSRQLTQIATSPQLGAPPTDNSTTQSPSGNSGSGGSGSSQSGNSGNSGSGGSGSAGPATGTGTRVDLAGSEPAVPAAVTNTVGTGPVLGLFAVLAAIVAAGAFTAFRRRRNRTGGTGR